MSDKTENQSKRSPSPDAPNESAQKKSEQSSIGSPLELGWKDWWRTLKRVVGSAGADNIPLLGAGVGFYLFLALFPAIIATVSIYGLLFDPASVQEQLRKGAAAMPSAAHSLLSDQLERLTSASPTALGWGTAIGIAAALWSASKAAKGMMGALNIVYGEAEGRSFVRKQGVGLLLTLVIVAGVVLALAMTVVIPPLLRFMNLGGITEGLVDLLRWPVLFALAIYISGTLYRLGPNHESPPLHWILPGAIAAAVLWLLASWGFSYFVANFGRFNETYGSIAAVVILMLWLMITATLILLGGELNHELEKARDRSVS